MSKTVILFSLVLLLNKVLFSAGIIECAVSYISEGLTVRWRSPFLRQRRRRNCKEIARVISSAGKGFVL